MPTNNGHAFLIGATIDAGYEMEHQEDYFQYFELDSDNLLSILADGSGSIGDLLQPASIVVNDIADVIRQIYAEDRDLFMQKPETFLKLAIRNANRVLGAFKMGNEEKYFGYAATCAACLFSYDPVHKSRKISLAHCGNTRVYILREGNLVQLTTDHTVGMEKVFAGEISEEDYYTHPDRMKLTSGVGVMYDPEIETLSGSLNERDLILMSSDGLHNAIRPEAIRDIILSSNSVVDATKNLVDAQKSMQYPDNVSAVVIGRNLER